MLQLRNLKIASPSVTNSSFVNAVIVGTTGIICSLIESYGTEKFYDDISLTITSPVALNKIPSIHKVDELQ